jgi:hypothetical protein
VIALFELTLGSERRVDYGRVAQVEAPQDLRRGCARGRRANAPAARCEPAFLVHNRALRALVLDRRGCAA